MAGRGCTGFGNIGGLQNNAGAGKTGKTRCSRMAPSLAFQISPGPEMAEQGVMEEIFKQRVAGAIAGTRTGRRRWGDAA